MCAHHKAESDESGSHGQTILRFTFLSCWSDKQPLRKAPPYAMPRRPSAAACCGVRIVSTGRLPKYFLVCLAQLHRNGVPCNCLLGLAQDNVPRPGKMQCNAL